MDHLKTPNEKVADQITLTKVNAYAIEAAEDDRQNAIMGYYKDFNLADHKRKKIGWYGADGVVKTAVLHTDGKQLYEVKPLGNYTDIAEQEHREIVDAIKSKLSPGELEYIAKIEGKL